MTKRYTPEQERRIDIRAAKLRIAEPMPTMTVAQIIAAREALDVQPVPDDLQTWPRCVAIKSGTVEFSQSCCRDWACTCGSA